MHYDKFDCILPCCVLQIGTTTTTILRLTKNTIFLVIASYRSLQLGESRMFYALRQTSRYIYYLGIAVKITLCYVLSLHYRQLIFTAYSLYLPHPLSYALELSVWHIRGPGATVNGFDMKVCHHTPCSPHMICVLGERTLHTYIPGMMNLWYRRGRLHCHKCFKNSGGVIRRVCLVLQTVFPVRKICFVVQLTLQVYVPLEILREVILLLYVKS